MYFACFNADQQTYTQSSVILWLSWGPFGRNFIICINSISIEAKRFLGISPLEYNVSGSEVHTPASLFVLLFTTLQTPHLFIPPLPLSSANKSPSFPPLCLPLTFYSPLLPHHIFITQLNIYLSAFAWLLFSVLSVFVFYAANHAVQKQEGMQEKG